jgi:hypothetical protein
MKALIAGSLIACALGVAVGANMKAGLHRDGPDLRGAADSLVQFAVPAAEAAETAAPAPTIDQPSPVLYVRSGNRWVTETERASEQADAQNAAAMQAQRVADQTSVDGANDAAADRQGDPVAPLAHRNGGGALTDPPPPPLIVSLNSNP